MDVSQALKDTENALRDFMTLMLSQKFGDQWHEHAGVSPERLKRWAERKRVEERRQQFSGTVEERLIYYADFYDLKTILKKHWSEFAQALGEWKTMEVWLEQLEKLRDPEAHRRELLPHQQHLILGIAGEIRTRLVRYRSKLETSEDYYPRIESVRDNLGNLYVSGMLWDRRTGMRLRVGDFLEFVITATDPLGEPLQYKAIAGGNQRFDSGWQEENVLAFTLTKAQVKKCLDVLLFIRSRREFHADQDYDDAQIFSYEVLPPRQ